MKALEIPVLNGVERDIFSELFQDFKSVVEAVCHNFAVTYGGNFDDHLEGCNEYFVRGVYAWREKINHCGPDFEAHIKKWLWIDLVNAYRGAGGRRKVNSGLPSTNADLSMEMAPQSDSRSLGALYAEMTQDGEYCARLVCDPPLSIAMRIAERGGQYRNYKSVLRSYLTESGWDNNRINAAFDSIRGALKS